MKELRYLHHKYIKNIFNLPAKINCFLHYHHNIPSPLNMLEANYLKYLLGNRDENPKENRQAKLKVLWGKETVLGLLKRFIKEKANFEALNMIIP